MPDITLIIDYANETGLSLPGVGRVWQGSGPDLGLHQFFDTRNRMLVQMAADIGSLHCRDMKSVIFMGIDDGPSGVLPDQTLLSLTGLLVAWLRSDGDLVLGCVAGVSRSGYINIATMMQLTGWPFERCLDRIRLARPQVNPMACFVEQLVRLHPLLARPGH